MRTVRKRWGNYKLFELNKKCTVKILTVEKGKRLSLQRHRLRDEFWYVLYGCARIYLGKNANRLKTFIATPGSKIRIPHHVWHYTYSIADFTEILEVSTGHFDEKDIERAEL